MTPDARFQSLKRRYLALRLSEIILLAAGSILLTHGLASLWTSGIVIKLPLSIAAGVFVFVMRSKTYRLFQLDNISFAGYLNKQFPQLMSSADLLLKSADSLPGIQQLQRDKTAKAFEAIYPEIKLPNLVGQSGVIFLVCVGIHFGLSSYAITDGVQPGISRTITTLPTIENPSPAPTIRSMTVKVYPPRYTQLGTFESQGLNLAIPEGSDVTWQIEFDGNPGVPSLLLSGKDSIIAMETENHGVYHIKLNIKSAGFYQLQWGKQHSDYYKIEIIKDQPPKVEISNLGQFTKLKLTDNHQVVVTSNISDDYGLSDAIITATVSKGSGESVKFREEQIRFTSPTRIIGKQVHATVTLSLDKLGLEPGDELYFFAEAIDNKSPVANRHRTETYFISLQDTTTEITTTDAGLGVDLMPEYFRSQRQIIIDTEKLLKEKKKITKQVFNSTSNELGFDQKALRLRYGQFLGEEADSGIGQQADEEGEEGEEGDEEDALKMYSHKHDTKNESNLVDDKKETNEKEGEEETLGLKDPSKAFTHNHDNTEEATFFILTVKAKLKAALALMWDAELYLRLFQPEKSLPYQYKVLNLLKEISNDSRIYVKRVGFEPPPLKEDKRLTADLSEVRSSTDLHTSTIQEFYPGIRQALAQVENMLVNKDAALSAGTRQIFQQAGNELSEMAIEQPGVYLKSLSILKALQDQPMTPGEMRESLLAIRTAFWKVLPPQTPTPGKSGHIRHKLDQSFLKSLESLKHE